MISELIKKTIEKRLEYSGVSVEVATEQGLESYGYRLIPHAAERKEDLANGVPTLAKGEFQALTPMLQERFEAYGRWEAAMHGMWLGLEDMAKLWEAEPEEEFLQAIKAQIENRQKKWPEHIYNQLSPNRISVFAGSDNIDECIILAWPEETSIEKEPEFWVYLNDQESRCQNLEGYLKSYLHDF